MPRRFGRSYCSNYSTEGALRQAIVGALPRLAEMDYFLAEDLAPYVRAPEYLVREQLDYLVRYSGLVATGALGPGRRYRAERKEDAR